MKKSTVLGSIVLVISVMSLIVSYTNYVLISLVTASITAGLGLVLLPFTWKNKMTRLFLFMSVALSSYAILQFYQVNEENDVPEIEVEQGESETEKQFEDQLEEEGFDDAFGEEEEAIELE